MWVRVFPRGGGWDEIDGRGRMIWGEGEEREGERCEGGEIEHYLPFYE